MGRGGHRDDTDLSLFRLLDPDVHADPYPFYARLRSEAPVHWDPFLHAWVVSRYADVLTVLRDFSADRTPSPAQLERLNVPALRPVAELMTRQMLFLNAPAHTGLRRLCSAALSSRQVDAVEPRIQAIADALIDAVAAAGEMDVIADFAEPLPAIVTADLLGVPAADHQQLKLWSADFAELLGNFQHNPDRTSKTLKSVGEMVEYFRNAIVRQRTKPARGLIHSMLHAEQEGARLSDDDIIANVIVTMVGGQETTTNLIGNGLLTLFRQPDKLQLLRCEPSLMRSAVEELLRYESPSQHTARIAPDDLELGGVSIKKGTAVIVIMAAANRDPEQFPDPDMLDLTRIPNRHLAFGWAAHFCFGAPLARLEGRIAFETLLRRCQQLTLAADSVTWRSNLGLRGLTHLPVRFQPAMVAA